MIAIEDSVGAFVPGPRAARAPLANGRLSGLTFAVKDLFDLAGMVTTYGNPDWASTHPPRSPPPRSCWRCCRLARRLAGKTRTQELAYGLTGENVWQGTPINPRRAGPLPGRLELRLGGGGSGVAGGFRAGLRHRRIGPHPGQLLRPVRHPPDASALSAWPAPARCRPASTRAAGSPARRRCSPAWARCCWPGPRRADGPLLRPRGTVGERPAGGGGGIAPGTGKAGAPARPGDGAADRAGGDRQLLRPFPPVQAEEAWAALGGWVEAAKPRFGPGVGERFAAAKASIRRSPRQDGPSAGCCRRVCGRCWPAGR